MKRLDLFQGIERQLGTCLRQIQEICIGVFKHDMSDKWELVVNEENDMLDTVTIGELFGLQTNYSIPTSKGLYRKFPDGKMMSDMLENPITFQEWWKQNCQF
jgi:hypothetical protein